MIKIDDEKLKMFFKEKGYAESTIRQHSRRVRQVNREGLTEEDVDLKHKDDVLETRKSLQRAVRRLNEFEKWGKNERTSSKTKTIG
jgi:hypothetical protein